MTAVSPLGPSGMVVVRSTSCRSCSPHRQSRSRSPRRWSRSRSPRRRSHSRSPRRRSCSCSPRRRSCSRSPAVYQTMPTAPMFPLVTPIPVTALMVLPTRSSSRTWSFRDRAPIILPQPVTTQRDDSQRRSRSPIRLETGQPIIQPYSPSRRQRSPYRYHSPHCLPVSLP